ncbi:uncharacterized protein LOC122042270 [Zingiber officinale]|uniref:uncharacterized protein LOC122042270 n=1 Tax=Zingiber officinale TaxID=94328 RepID=UPI001C4B82D3|nr:uncharacterized protein LOC122042270 [Zingiber officinale]XP_042458222.1 uncharacterized protein LOC122042270 [Zingiber officinale]XP_042458223.1 uncharacterized protein LOC122042270 [Zingiber officinale]
MVAASTAVLLSPPPSVALKPILPTLNHTSFPSKPTPSSRPPTTTKLFASSSSSSSSSRTVSPKSPTTSSGGEAREKEKVFFDGGAHYGDLVANLLLGFTLLWLPLTLAAVSRAFFLRYRFTDRRVTVISGFTGQDRSDFPYSSIQDVQIVPRFIGEWGDLVITLKDGTKVDLRSVPKFREISKYCLSMADGSTTSEAKGGAPPRGF